MIIDVMTILFYIAIVFAIYKLMTVKDDSYTLDEFTSTNYLDQLQKMIEYQTIYTIDVKFGNLFREKKALSENISNNEIYEAAIEIQNKVISKMSKKMMSYLFDAYGNEWIFDYIKIYTLSMVVNYSSYSIESIIKEKK